jgi:hypothetical protein
MPILGKSEICQSRIRGFIFPFETKGTGKIALSYALINNLPVFVLT